MKKMYFVRKGNLYLYKDGYFYEGFKMDPYAVSEEMAIAYKNNGKEEIDIEYVDPDKWPDFYVDTREQQPMQTQQEKTVF